MHPINLFLPATKSNVLFNNNDKGKIMPFIMYSIAIFPFLDEVSEQNSF